MTRRNPILFGKIFAFFLILKLDGLWGIEFCTDCPQVQIPDALCATKWIPQYGQFRADKDCQCLKKYVCCPSQCPRTDENVCLRGTERAVMGKDCCGCPTLRCAKCPAPKSAQELNCSKCFKYALVENGANGCFEAACARKDSPKNPPVICNACERQVIELDSCGLEKSTCKKEPCACQSVPKCYGSQVLKVESDSCECQRLSCGCERECPSISEPVCDHKGNLHSNWCQFGIEACKLEKNLQVLKIAPLSSCQGKGYEELRDYGAVWRRFWWFDAAASNSAWPADETDVLGKPFGACLPNATHCFGRLPERLSQDSTQLLAIDGAGNAFKWVFDAANPTSIAAWRAFHDHAETKAGAVLNNRKWNPEVMAGAQPPEARDQDSFMYRDQFGVKSLLLDDDNCDCLSTLSMGSGMCLQGHDTRFGPERVFGVDNLDDPGCQSNKPSNSLSLYYADSKV